MGILLVVAGPSGAGKGTIVRRLLEREPSFWYSVSATTRAPRPGEVDGRDYHFVSRDEFERLRDSRGFVEWFEVYGDLYGTPRAPVEERLAHGGDVVLELDVQGALAVREALAGAVLVFVKPPSRDAQHRRLLERGGDDTAEIERRLAEADAEEALAVRFDAVIVNDDLDTAVGEVAAILDDCRARDPGASPPTGPEHA